MNKISQSVFIIVVSLLTSLLTFSVHGKSQQETKSFTVSNGGTVYLDSELGDVEVEVWNKSEVQVLVEKNTRNRDGEDEFSVKYKQEGNKIYIDGDRNGGWNSNIRVEFIIKVPEHFNVDINTGGGAISVADGLHGKIKLDTSGGSIKVGDIPEGELKAETSGGSIKVGDVNGNLSVDTSGGSIQLGNVTGSSSINTSGGSIKLESGGSDVVAETSGGSIKIGPVKGKVNVETSGGSITIGLAESDVVASTSGGTVKVEGSKGKVDVESSGGNLYVGSSGGAIKASTAGGSIQLLQARGSIDADTAGGKIEAELISISNDKDAHVNLSSSGGPLTLYLPKDLAFSITATIKINRFSRNDYRVYSDFPLTIKGDGSDRISAQGEVNGGGIPIVLRTSNGDIHIKAL